VPRRDETDSGSGDRSTVTRPSRLVLSDPGNALAADARIRLSRSLRGDLDRIVLRAVAWEPAERYDSAAALADDLDRYLRGEPVLAAPPSVAYRVRKLVLRHRLASTLALLAVLALTIGAVVAIAGWREALVARRAADREAARAEFVRRFFLMDMLAAASPAATREQELTVAELLEEAERAAPLRLSAAPDVLRDVYGQLGAAYYRLSRAEDSIRVLARAIELTSTLEGPDSDAALRLRIEHAGAMFSVPGRHEEAGELRRRNLADALRLVGENHPTALRARLASASDMEDPAAVRAEVESLYREIERQGIEEPELVVGVLRALGAIYALSEDAEAAIGVARRMVALTEGQFGRLHSHTISSRRRLGEILCESGSTKEGLDVVDEALADARAFYPRGHGSLKGLLQIAVNVNGKYGRPQRGLELADEVVAIQRELGDPSGIPLDAALSLRGAVLVRLGRFQEARTALEEVLPRRIAQWGEGSGQVGSDMRALGEACMELGDLDGALQWAQRALAHQKPGSPGYVGSAIIDARVRAERGDRRGALERLRAVQSMEMSGEWRRTLEGVIAELSREQP